MQEYEKTNSAPVESVVRLLLRWLIGKEHTDNLYGEHQATREFQRKAEVLGVTVVRCVNNVSVYRLPDGVIYPLTDSEEYERRKYQECVTLVDKLQVERHAGNHSSATDNRKCVPPIFKLQPGQWISHVLVKPNGGDHPVAAK